MSNQIPSNAFNNNLEIVLPPFRGLPSVSLDMSALKEAERRILEAKTVNVSTYCDLESCFNEAYRELKRNLATISYQIMQTQKEIDKIKAVIFLDKYPEFLKERGSKFDNSTMRDAFLMKDDEYVSARERFDSLKATEIFLEGRVKVMENVSRYMKKQMDLVLRQGFNSNIYNK